MSERLNFENTSKKKEELHLLESLKKLGIVIEADPIQKESAYFIKFPFEKDIITTIRILFNHDNGTDLVITNMTTLPDNQTGQGFGSKAIQQLLQWAKENNLTNIMAVQVQGNSEKFWTKNGFIRDKEPNECNDFVYQNDSQ